MTSHDDVQDEVSAAGDGLAGTNGVAAAPATDPPAPSGPEGKDDKERLNGWYFPELEGPDVTRDLAPGEREFWHELRTMSISDIWSLDLESDPEESIDRVS